MNVFFSSSEVFHGILRFPLSCARAHPKKRYQIEQISGVLQPWAYKNVLFIGQRHSGIKRAEGFIDRRMFKVSSSNVKENDLGYLWEGSQLSFFPRIPRVSEDRAEGGGRNVSERCE